MITYEGRKVVVKIEIQKSVWYFFLLGGGVTDHSYCCLSTNFICFIVFIWKRLLFVCIMR